jgi:DNA-binding transcriptional MerR regulator
MTRLAATAQWAEWIWNRHCSHEDLDRVRRILLYRAIGFTLEQVAEMIDDAGVDERFHLRHQRQLLERRIARLMVSNFAQSAPENLLPARTAHQHEQGYPLRGEHSFSPTALSETTTPG